MPPFRRPAFLECLAVALASAGLAQLVVVPYLWLTARPVSLSFLWGHGLFVLAVQSLLALSLLGRAGNRPLAVCGFLLPVGAAVATAGFLRAVPPWAWVVAFAVATGAMAAFSVRLRSRASPLAAAAMGSIAGAELIRFRLDAFVGFATPTLEVARTVVLGVALVLATVVAGRYQLPAFLPRAKLLPLAGCVAFTASGLLALVAPGSFLLTHPPGWRGGSGPPVVLIVLDTLRADHLRLYGYGRDTMPRLEAFVSKQAVRLERAITTHPSSLEAHASMFTGLVPPRHGAHRREREHWDHPLPYYPLSEEVVTLAERLREAGYWTVGLSANFAPLAREFGLSQGFDIYRSGPDDMRRRSPWGSLAELSMPLRAMASLDPFCRTDFVRRTPYRNAEGVTDEAIAVLDGAGDGPLFLFLNYFDPHEPQLPPFELRDTFPGRSVRLSEWQLARGTEAAVLAGERDLSPEERGHVTALYDAELAGLDRALGRLLERLARHPRFAESLVIVLSDHGEALGEHRLLGHSLHLYDEFVRIPFFVKPGSRSPNAPPPGATVEGLHQPTDVFPLVLEHAGLSVPAGIDGVAWGRGRTVANSWAFAFREQALANPRRFDRLLRSAEHDGMKLIESDRGDLELYDLKTDPAEERNLAQERPDLVARLRALLPEVAPERPDRDATSGAQGDPELLEKLRALGYVQ